MRGGEKVLRDFCELFPNSEIFTLFWDKEAKLDNAISELPIHASILNKLPGVKGYYRNLLPFFFFGIGSLNKKLLAEHKKNSFDVVISVSHCAAKNIVPPEGVKHVCYCLTPARYLWDQFDRYVQNPIKKVMIRPIRKTLQQLDRVSSVDHWIGISKFIAGRIYSAYSARADIIYPAVDMVMGSSNLKKQDFYLVVNEFVPYKNTDKIIEAFNELGFPLIVVGKGPQESYLRSIASSNVKFYSNLPRADLESLYLAARAFVFAAEEDFGMTPVEAQSAGTPVIALSRGGALETVEENQSGLFFNELTSESIKSAVLKFSKNSTDYSAQTCRNSARRFQKNVFNSQFLELFKRIEILKLESQTELTLKARSSS
jgi:glycosyltransferase involved in cell wall biosynthesis